jgi:hypothetical protein
MRKLYAVKELNHSSDEDNDEQFNEFAREENQNAFTGNYEPSSHGIEMRALNNFSRLFINEEDEEDLEDLDSE